MTGSPRGGAAVSQINPEMRTPRKISKIPVRIVFMKNSPLLSENREQNTYRGVVGKNFNMGL
jgi:hypothetical protein